MKKVQLKNVKEKLALKCLPTCVKKWASDAIIDSNYLSHSKRYVLAGPSPSFALGGFLDVYFTTPNYSFLVFLHTKGQIISE